MMMTKHDLPTHPELVTRTVEHAGERFVLRLICEDDADSFGRYLDGLSETTRMLFGPHPLNSEEAKKLCSALDPLSVMRFGLFTDEGAMVGYFLLFPEVRSSEIDRYAKTQIKLTPLTDCTFAPSIADEYQSKGVGSAVMRQIIDIAAELGFKRMVLCGGTQERNTRAVAFYRKHGFETIGEFITQSQGEQLINYDMILSLESTGSKDSR